jgi:membrane fusion protein, hemolysin D
MKSAEIIPPPRVVARRGSEREFLPAALEIVETPASPAGRAIAATIILFFVLALAWAWVGRIDIVATASGKIVPSGRTKVVQPFETGVVRAIHVRDGQSVAAGEVLIELDATINAAERDRFAAELVVVQLEVARLRAALMPGTDPLAFVPPDGANPRQVELQRSLLRNQLEEYRSKLAGIDRQMTQNEANRAAVAATVDKLAAALPLLRQRAEARKYLAEKEVGSRLQYLEVQQDLVEHEKELIVQQSRLDEAKAGLAGLVEQRLHAEAEFHRTNLGDLAQAEQKAGSLQQEVVKARQHAELQVLTAPVAGTVQQLAVHTVGGVVTPAQALMVVVPGDSRLEIEAMVPNRDIGFVRVGQRAEIKVDTFNFTRYGLLQGEVLTVSQDAIARDRAGDKSGDKSSAGAESDSSEPKGQELVYAARVSLDSTQMEVEDRMVNLTPGMAVTVEIKTGSRRVLEYLLSPLMRYKQAALRER